jgi:hypothetical protein
MGTYKSEPNSVNNRSRLEKLRLLSNKIFGEKCECYFIALNDVNFLEQCRGDGLVTTVILQMLKAWHQCPRVHVLSLYGREECKILTHFYC